MRKAVDLITASEQRININKFPANFLMTSFDDMSPREIAYAAHVAGRMHIPNENFWKRLSAAAIDAATKSPPKYLAPILFSLATRSSESDMTRLLEEFARKSSDARGSDVALTVKAAAKSGRAVSAFLEGVIKEGHVRTMSSREKLLTAISMSKMRMNACVSILPVIATEIANDLIDLNPDELSGLLRAFASSKVSVPTDVCHHYLAHIGNCITRSSPETLVALVAHLGDLGLWSEDIASRAVDNFLENFPAFSADSAAQVLHAFISLAPNSRPKNLEIAVSRGGRKIFREIDSLSVKGLVSAYMVFESFASPGNLNFLNFKESFNFKCFKQMETKLMASEIFEIVDLLQGPFKSVAEKVGISRSFDLSALEMVDFVSQVCKIGKVDFALRLAKSRNFSLTANIAMGKLLGGKICDLEIANLAELCETVVQFDCFDSEIEARIREEISRFNRELTKKEAVMIAATLFKFASAGEQPETCEAMFSLLAKNQLPDEVINLTLRACLVIPRVSDRTRDACKVAMLQLCEISGSCKTYCRALQAVSGRFLRILPDDIVALLITKAVASASELPQSEIHSFLRLLKKAGINKIEAMELQPHMAIRLKQEPTLHRRKIMRQLCLDIGIDAEEADWSSEMIDEAK